jgi:hypothetical protein
VIAFLAAMSTGISNLVWNTHFPYRNNTFCGADFPVQHYNGTNVLTVIPRCSYGAGFVSSWFSFIFAVFAAAAVMYLDDRDTSDGGLQASLLGGAPRERNSCLHTSLACLMMTLTLAAGLVVLVVMIAVHIDRGSLG